MSGKKKKRESQAKKERRLKKESANAAKKANRAKKSRIGALSKVLSKKDSLTGSKGVGVENTSYEFTPSYMFHNGRVATLVQLYVRKGSSRNLTFTDVLDVIPTSPREDIKIYMIEMDGVLRDEEKKNIIKENAGKGLKVIENEEKDEAKTDRKEGLSFLVSHRKDASEREMDASDKEDYYLYELLVDSPEPVVYFRVMIAIVGDTVESVEEQLEDLNTALDQRHAGMRWDSIAGDQYERYRNLYRRLEKEIDGSVDTATGANYAGLNFAVSPGLCDPSGVIIGDDVLSLVESAAVFDFDKSTDGYATVAIPSSEQIAFYERDDLRHVSAASLVAQSAANDIVMRGHKAAHIVLNDFDYLEDNRGYIRPVTDAGFKSYDVSRMTINPMQGFGTIDEVTSVFPRLTAKITNIFDLLDDMVFERTGKDGLLYKGLVQDAVYGFYLRHGLWTSDAALYPYRTNIVEIKKPEMYPTMGILTQEFTSMEEEARHKGSPDQANLAKALHSVLSHSLDAALDVLGRPTSIEPTSALQTYYMFDGIVDPKMKQVQFLNILDYVIYTLEKGDVLVVHGSNLLYKAVLTKMAHATFEAALKKGIRVIFSFDTVTSPNTNEFDGMNGSDVFSMRGPYYTDFGSDVSWSMMGAMLDEEVDEYAHIMNNAAFSDAIRIQATARGMCQVLLHRDMGRVNNFIRLMPIL